MTTPRDRYQQKKKTKKNKPRFRDRRLIPELARFPPAACCLTDLRPSDGLRSIRAMVPLARAHCPLPCWPRPATALARPLTASSPCTWPLGAGPQVLFLIIQNHPRSRPPVSNPELRRTWGCAAYTTKPDGGHCSPGEQQPNQRDALRGVVDGTTDVLPQQHAVHRFRWAPGSRAPLGLRRARTRLQPYLADRFAVRPGSLGGMNQPHPSRIGRVVARVPATVASNAEEGSAKWLIRVRAASPRVIIVATPGPGAGCGKARVLGPGPLYDPCSPEHEATPPGQPRAAAGKPSPDHHGSSARPPQRPGPRAAARPPPVPRRPKPGSPKQDLAASEPTPTYCCPASPFILLQPGPAVDGGRSSSALGPGLRLTPLRNEA